MIGNLRGILIEREASTVVVECAGVGYEVTASSHTLGNLNDLGSEVSLRIYTHFQDHKIALYGFGSIAERELFDLLITVKNVGPSSAIKILSAAKGPVAIAQLIAAEEVKTLQKIKGIGKKTSEMLVVELHEKCQALLLNWGAESLGSASSGEGEVVGNRGSRSNVQADVIMALVQLGFKQPTAEKAVDLIAVEEGATLESVMRQALQALPR